MRTLDKRNKIPQPPKTVTCRHANATVQGSNALLVKRKSLDKAKAGAGVDSLNVSAVVPGSTPGAMSSFVALSGTEKGRNGAATM